MKLSQIGNIPSKELTYIDPYTQQETGIKIKVHPKNSKVGMMAEHTLRMKIAELIRDENNVIEIEGQKNLKPELITQVSLEMIADLIEGWSGITGEDDKAFKFTKENALIALKQEPTLAEAIINFSSDISNFLKSKKKS